MLSTVLLQEHNSPFLPVLICDQKLGILKLFLFCLALLLLRAYENSILDVKMSCMCPVQGLEKLHASSGPHATFLH